MATDTDAPPDAAQRAAAPQTASAAVTRMERDVSDLTSPARFQWEPEQVEAIRHTVAKDCTGPEFVMFLELAARYKLDPFAKQIWAARMGDGQPIAIIVGRDGLLSIAERYEEFEGMDSDVVVEGDRLIRDKATGEFIHEWGEGHLVGKIIGAWATVYRSDRQRPITFYARWDEYAKQNSKFWQRYKSAMIVKCAESMALKRAFTISGVLVEEEVSEYQEHGVINRASVIEWGQDPLLAAWLQELVEAANKAKKNAYRPQKILALLKGRDDSERRAFAQEVMRTILAHDGTIPDPPESLAEVAIDAADPIRWKDGGEVIDGTVADEPQGEPEPDVEPESVREDG
jgi:phage recombination protein Bet